MTTYLGRQPTRREWRIKSPPPPGILISMRSFKKSQFSKILTAIIVINGKKIKITQKYETVDKKNFGPVIRTYYYNTSDGYGVIDREIQRRFTLYILYNVFGINKFFFF